MMGASVLALFGVAAYKTATAPNEPARDVTVVDQDAYAARIVREDEAARAEAARQHHEEVVAATLTMYGAEAATMGRLFDGVSIGRDRDALSPEARSALSVFSATTDAKVDLGPGSTGAIGTITISKIPTCATLDTLLRDAWGRGESLESENAVIWLNHITHQRAVFIDSQTDCSLAFSAYVVPEDWLATLSLDLVGASAKLLPSADWDVAGVGAGTQMTHVEVTTNGRTVTEVTTSTTVTERTRNTLVGILTAKHGAPKETVGDDEVRRFTWRAPKLVLQIDGDTITLTAGAR